MLESFPLFSWVLGVLDTVSLFPASFSLFSVVLKGFWAHVRCFPGSVLILVVLLGSGGSGPGSVLISIRTPQNQNPQRYSS